MSKRKSNRTVKAGPQNCPGATMTPPPTKACGAFRKPKGFAYHMAWAHREAIAAVVTIVPEVESPRVVAAPAKTARRTRNVTSGKPRLARPAVG